MFKKIQISIIIFGIFLFGFYGTCFRQYNDYKKYNGMHGIVTNVFESKTCRFIDVRLDDGLCGSVTVGYQNYKIGDDFINDVDYYRFYGHLNISSYIFPHMSRCLIENMILFLYYLIIIGVILFFYFKYLFGNKG